MSRYLALIHVLLIVVWSCWHPMPSSLAYWSGLLWLAFWSVFLGLAFTWQRGQESADMACHRSWRTLRRDPLLLLALLGQAFLVIQAANGGRELAYDAAVEQWAFGKPTLPWAPAHVAATASWQAAALFFIIVGGVLTVRHTMTKTGRQLLLQLMSLNGALWALWRLVGAALHRYGGVPALPVAWPADTAAAIYLLLFAISFGLMLTANLSLKYRWVPPVAALLNFGGVLLADSPLVIVCAWLLALILLLYGVIYSRLVGKQCNLPRYMLVAWGVILIAMVPWLAVYGAHDLPTATGELWQAWYLEDGAAAVMVRLFSDAPWYGQGAGCFEVLANVYGWQPQRGDGYAFGFGALTLLSEYGLVGCAVFASAIVLLLVEVFRRLALTRLLPPVADTLLGRSMVFRLTPLAVSSLLGLGAVALASLFTGGFAQSVVIFCVMLTMAALTSFLPLRKRL